MRYIDVPGHTTGRIELLCTRLGVGWYSADTWATDEEATCPACLGTSAEALELFKKESAGRLKKAIAYVKAYEDKNYKLALEIEQAHWMAYVEEGKNNADARN